MDEQKICKIICQVRDEAKNNGIQASFVVHHEHSHLMRIGNNSVSLNTSESLTRLDVTVYKGKKIGKHTQMGEIDSTDYVKSALKIANEKAEMSTENAYILSVPVIEKNFNDIKQYDEKIISVLPKEKASIFKQIFNKIGNEYNYSGAWSSGSVKLFVASTASSNIAWHAGTDMQFNLVLKHPTEKWEIKTSQTGWKYDDFNIDKSINELKELLNIYSNNKGIKIVPEEYTIAFGAEAVAEVLAMAAETGLKGREYEEKQGWTANNKIGDKIFSDKVTLTDDPTNEQTFCFAFDNCGYERKPFTLIKDGKLVALAYDAIGAAKFNKKLTGHNLNSLSLVLASGKDSSNILEVSKDLGKVIYIPMLHYLGLPNMGKGVFTGSSRFNGVLIENGKIVGPIFSARVTDTF